MADTAQVHEQTFESDAEEARPCDNFMSELASLYAAFSARQQPLGEEFERAIFSDLDSLYG